ncbi:MAG: DUF2793 domain-containing protein [Hyphomicrobiaceae bacterium]
MDATPNLDLPYIMAAQAQKHVTHNEAIRVLDAIVQLAVLDRDLDAPPASPAEGDRYIVATSASGGWTGHDLEVAAFQDGAWSFYAPAEGWLAWVADEDSLVAWDGADWVATSGATNLNPAALVGVNTTADATNRLAAKSDAVLFSHDDVTPGTGDQRTILNKAAAGNTASFVYQTAFSGRAEIGLAGDDDFSFKVSADGAVWTEALRLKKDGSAVVAGVPVRHTAPPKLPTYTVATRPSAATYAAGSLIYVSDWPGGGIAMVSDGTAWRPVPRRRGRVSEILDGDEGVAFNFGLARGLVADFTGSLSVSGRADDMVTLTRASDGTFIGSNGLLQSASSNVLRYTYDPVARDKGRLLLEGAATNLLVRSAEFGSWSAAQCSVSSNAAAAPDGTTTADKIVEDSATNSHYLLLGATGTTNTNQHVFSVWAKADSRSVIRLRFFEGSTFTRNVFADFDLSAGTASAATTGGATATSAGIEAFAGGWYRCWVSCVLGGSDTTIQARVHILSAVGVSSYAGDGTSGLYVWGAQLEVGSVPTSYIATTSSTATRSADSLVVGPSTFPVQASGECTLYVRWRIKSQTASTSGKVRATNSSDSEYISFRETTVIGGADLAVYDNPAFVVDTASQAITLGAEYALAASVRANDAKFYVNGAQFAADTSLTVPTIDRLAITPGSGSIYEIDEIAYIARALGAAELAALTAL